MVAYLLPMTLNSCGGLLFWRQGIEMLSIAVKKGTVSDSILELIDVTAFEDKSGLMKFRRLITAGSMLAIGVSIIGLIGLVYAFPIFTTFEIKIISITVPLMYGSVLTLWVQTSKLKPEILDAQNIPLSNISIYVNTAFVIGFLMNETSMIVIFLGILFFFFIL